MNGAGSGAGALPAVVLDRGTEMSLPAQLVAELRSVIDAGTMRPGEPLPPTRAFAARLGVSRGTVVTAYEQLVAEGYLAAGHGKGTVVNPDLGRLQVSKPRQATGDRAAGTGPAQKDRSARTPAAPTQPAPSTLPATRGPLAPNAVLADATLSPAWRAAWREAAAHAHELPPALGDDRLRAEIAEHLRRMRGTRRDPTELIVTSGARDGLGLLLTSLGTTRGRSLVVGVEDPGYPSLRAVAARHGARVVALETDAEGLVTSSLPDGLLDLVIVTPSHQHPVGAALPLVRRRALIDWARRTGAVVVEDDYDSELRYAGSPLPALAALDDPEAGVVVTLGSFSSTVTPALAAGYLLAPAGLRAHLEPVRVELGGPVSAIVQSALAGVLASGEIRRHTARMRRRYAGRRALVTQLLAEVHGIRVRPMHGGLHAVIEFEGAAIRGFERSANSSPGSRAAVNAEIATAARCEQLGAVSLRDYWQRRGPIPGPSGLVIGMGGSSEGAFRRALIHLAAVLTERVADELEVGVGRADPAPR